MSLRCFHLKMSFFFICSNDHLNNSFFNMAKILNEICPNGQIIGIDSHKLGPVFAVLRAENLFGTDEPVVVNYCDFTCYWNWSEFKKFVFEESDCVGVVPAYRGFHPHSLGTTNYAYLNVKGQQVLDIKRKEPFTANRMNEFASSGTYFFKSSRRMFEAMHELFERNLSINGEYYVSLVYKILLENGEKVSVFPLQHFMQWGTPEDLQEYCWWSESFKRLAKKINQFKKVGSLAH